MKWIGFVFSLGVGLTCGWLIGHMLGPDPKTRFDATYRSRLDQAWAEGRKAAEAHSQELWQEFDRRRQKPPIS